jgi:hypothetical protein
MSRVSPTPRTGKFSVTEFCFKLDFFLSSAFNLSTCSSSLAENTERRGESENDPVKKSRQAQFLKEYWEIKNNGDRKSAGPMVRRSMKDVAEAINLDERSTRRLLKLNDLIPEIQLLVSSEKLSVRAAEQLAFLSVELPEIFLQYI